MEAVRVTCFARAMIEFTFRLFNQRIASSPEARRYTVGGRGAWVVIAVIFQARP